MKRKSRKKKLPHLRVPALLVTVQVRTGKHHPKKTFT
jgi:hypothetical protein